ncbi:NEDD8-conjugating enzyme Ubc12 [Histoplasma capsulatum]|uniref:NEDD8-conjugating enzyme UBC12 n=3 Tax=Ajellomyces capsulatus TaxID=5037 RepID=C0NZK2_AJECG|nr:NEDD8-conjugating enzyme UBC12 [Histoplasma capsulatum G186AR]EGC45193.1 NEDD8-conjugating enzyme Ubc12 [Histoplasma capsulatum var. duboisii H88]KAG5287218.1 NEDD8-conjugating enzyme ubc12 [Histoplasma ohiense (nom. inval.)]KAG5290343.1 NEDD8-conjugating enzyme UBC12 [Histoplasma capsulatum]EEH03250.1 NEDD8-conjugating enzyme UBC12 [Histoplasma capsulatum G186AR]QSS55963.1 NEDD8-conjugating enzyme Ubc12 [Histoplasma capsulatum var. duboisii H88]
MLKILSMKKKQQAEAAAAGQTKNRVGGAKARIQHDLLRVGKQEEEESRTGARPIKFEWKNGDDPFHFSVVIEPDEGMYKGGSFKFNFDIPEHDYPFEPPRVKCTQRIYHPNIDPQGNVCLNILRDGWTAALDVQAVAFGLLHIFIHTTYEDPLIQEVADDLRLNREGFRRNVRTAMQGGTVRNTQYDRVLKS